MSCFEVGHSKQLRVAATVANYKTQGRKQNWCFRSVQMCRCTWWVCLPVFAYAETPQCGSARCFLSVVWRLFPGKSRRSVLYVLSPLLLIIDITTHDCAAHVRWLTLCSTGGQKQESVLKTLVNLALPECSLSLVFFWLFYYSATQWCNIQHRHITVRRLWV